MPSTDARASAPAPGRSLSGPRIDRIGTRVYQIPTDAPESDGTLAWDSTTLILVEVQSAGERGLGFTHAAGATGMLVAEVLANTVLGGDALHFAESMPRGQPGRGAIVATNLGERVREPV